MQIVPKTKILPQAWLLAVCGNKSLPDGNNIKIQNKNGAPVKRWSISGEASKAAQIILSRIQP